MGKKVSVIRREHFCAAHRLYNPKWDDAKNEEVFGICSRPNYHGHNYELEVKVTGAVNKKSGYVMDMKTLSNLIKQEVHQRFDHKNLNLDTKEFKKLNPTAENIVIIIYKLLRPHINKAMELNIRLYETAKNFVEYPVG